MHQGELGSEGSSGEPRPPSRAPHPDRDKEARHYIRRKLTTERSSREIHETRTKLIRGYTAFVGAALFAYVTKGGPSTGSVVVCLLAIALPALVSKRPVNPS